MSKLSVNHRAVVEGKLPKAEFLRQTRQQLPNLISQYTSYEDAIQILHNKGMLSEEVYLADVYRFPIEQMENGVRYELEQTGDYIPDEEEWEKAKNKVIENLKKDPLYYVRLIEKGKLLENKEVVEEGAVDNKAQADSEFQKKWIYFMSQEYADKLREAGKKPLDAAGAATKACLLVRKSFGSNWRPSKDILGNMRDASKKWKMQYMGERDVKDAEGKVKKVPMFNQSYGIKEAKNQPFRGSARGGVEASRGYQKPLDSDKVDVTTEPWYKEAEKLFLKVLAKKPISKKTGKPYTVTDCYNMVLRYYPNYKPSRDFMKSNELEWLDRANGQLAYKAYHESMDKSEEMLLREALTKIIPSVLSEAATTNLAHLSDENATIQGIPAILNSLENIVTEIESFIIKEQSKIQGVFDNIGNIKNEDNIPIGYKFVEPIMNSFKEDLAPVLEKINFESIKLPEAPVEGGEELQQPEAEDVVAPEEEKASVFAPRGAAPNPLAESKVKKGRYTTII